MPDAPANPNVSKPPPDWSSALPETVSEPTLWPPAFSLAITLCLWGLVSSLIITVTGVVLFIISLAGWIGEIRHERRTH